MRTGERPRPLRPRALAAPPGRICLRVAATRPDGAPPPVPGSSSPPPRQASKPSTARCGRGPRSVLSAFLPSLPSSPALRRQPPLPMLHQCSNGTASDPSAQGSAKKRKKKGKAGKSGSSSEASGEAKAADAGGSSSSSEEETAAKRTRLRVRVLPLGPSVAQPTHGPSPAGLCACFTHRLCFRPPAAAGERQGPPPGQVQEARGREDGQGCGSPLHRPAAAPSGPSRCRCIPDTGPDALRHFLCDCGGRTPPLSAQATPPRT